MLVFDTEASFYLPRTVSLVKKFGYLKKLEYSPWYFVPSSGLRKFRHGKSIALTKLVDG